MYEVTLIGQPGSFFTDRDPCDRETMDESGFASVRRADFKDSHTPKDGWRRRREIDAATALEHAQVRRMRINRAAVAASTYIETEEL